MDRYFKKKVDLLACCNKRTFISASSLERGYMIWSRRVPRLVYGRWGTWNIPSEGLITFPEKVGHKSLSTLKIELFPLPLGPSVKIKRILLIQVHFREDKWRLPAGRLHTSQKKAFPLYHIAWQFASQYLLWWRYNVHFMKWNNTIWGCINGIGRHHGIWGNSNLKAFSESKT